MLFLLQILLMVWYLLVLNIVHWCGMVLWICNVDMCGFIVFIGGTDLFAPLGQVTLAKEFFILNVFFFIWLKKGDDDNDINLLYMA